VNSRQFSKRFRMIQPRWCDLREAARFSSVRPVGGAGERRMGTGISPARSGKCREQGEWKGVLGKRNERMRKVTIKFQDVATELAQINTLRDDVMERAFGMLEQRHATLATMLVQSLGDRPRAVRWMCRHQNAFSGRTAYELIAGGEEDTVWDEIALMSDSPMAARLNAVRMAY
jgi:Protein of unknown function (DUF2384)